MPSAYLFYSSGPPCTIKIRQVVHGLPVAALGRLAVQPDDTRPRTQGIGLGQGRRFAIPSIGLRVQRGRWSFSLTQTKGLLSAIAGTAARQSTAHIPIAISRITDPASSRVELRRSPGRGGVARGYLLPNWENEDRGRHQFADRGSSRISQAFHPAYTTLHLKEASSFRRRAREKGCTPAALRDGDLIVAKCLWIIIFNQLIVASKLIARRSITLTGSTTGIRQPQFLSLAT